MRSLVIMTAFGLLAACQAAAAVYRVGPSRPWPDPNTLWTAGILADGDTVEIDAGIYQGTGALANWSNHNLLIRGTGGMAIMAASGQNLAGKSIWITSGNNITIENTGFTGCSVPDHNGAGIRSEGIDLTLRHCLFRDNENGILTNSPNAGHILIEFCEFDHNGYGDGYSHNVYVNHVAKLTFRFNYSHHAVVGHNLKSRAAENIIFCNRIMDEETGNSSRLIDLPNGGLSVVTGNLLMQGPDAENNNMVGYGLEGLTNPLPEFYFVNNTLVNKREASCRFLQVGQGTAVSEIVNNIFAGNGTILEGPQTLYSNNLSNPVISTFMFIDEPAYDYRLAPGSPAIDAGTMPGTAGGNSLMPDHVYLHPADSAIRTPFGVPDAGAYEYEWPVSVFPEVAEPSFFYPNPACSLLHAAIPAGEGLAGAFLCSSDGRRIYRSECINKAISLSGIAPGVYVVTAELFSGSVLRRVVVVGPDR